MLKQADYSFTTLMQGGKGSVTYVRFQNIQMYNVSHPILIDQNYYDSSACYSNEVSLSLSQVF